MGEDSERETESKEGWGMLILLLTLMMRLWLLKAYMFIITWFLLFPFLQKPNTVLEPDYQPLVMKNISTLPVNVLLSTSRPFCICETDKSPLPLTPEVS